MNYKEKIKNLKDRNRELKEVSRLTTEASREDIPLTKLEVRNIRKRNRRPHGNRNVQNSVNYVIELHDVTKTYVTGHTQLAALKRINIAIKRGEFIVVLGASGSGKSTLLNVMSGLDRVTEGEIIVNNINLAALSTRSLTTFRRNNVGFIFQSYNLLPELNARDNVELGRALQIDGTKRGDIAELFADMGIDNKLKSPITELSGGQLQRVSIARALAKKPDIIFADEPTGALDSESTAKVLELFRVINKKIGTTIVLVTHDKSIAKLADRVLIVKDGEAAFDV